MDRKCVRDSHLYCVCSISHPLLMECLSLKLAKCYSWDSYITAVPSGKELVSYIEIRNLREGFFFNSTSLTGDQELEEMWRNMLVPSRLVLVGRQSHFRETTLVLGNQFRSSRLHHQKNTIQTEVLMNTASCISSL